MTDQTSEPTYTGLVYYPTFPASELQALRASYDPYHDLLPIHLPFLFPVPESIGLTRLEQHIGQILSNWRPFRVHFCTVEKSWDHWLYVGIREGYGQVIELHDQLYTGVLRQHLRKELPYYPHLAIGQFTAGAYDIDHPKPKVPLDEKPYQQARDALSGLEINRWDTIESLTMVHLNADYTSCTNGQVFSLPS